MKSIKYLVPIVFVLTVVGFCSGAETINSEIVINNIDRSIDLSTQVGKVVSKLVLENTGKAGTNYFLYAVEPEFKNNVAFINAHIDSKHALRISPTTVAKQDYTFWKIELREELKPGRTVNVEVELSLIHAVTPYPSKITQKEKQLMLFNGNHYTLSPYKVLKQTTIVNTGNRNIESYSKTQKPVTQSDTSITFGPYTKILPFTVEHLGVHYENNSPFLTVTHLERVIEVSHWGNIAIEETVSLEHTGAQLKGSFSRYEYQREAQSGLASIKSFKTILPASASDAYYRDEIGNISTSHMRVLSDSVELDLRPRFPLFGGWKTKYTIGYNVPSYEYLYNNGDEFLLKIRILDHVFDEMVVDELVTRIILPEGTRNIGVKLPYTVQRLPDTWHFTYLDSVGRRVINLKKTNLVESHIQYLELNYTFPKILMLQEPLLAIAGFYVLFLCVIIYVRLDFSITKSEHSKKDD